MAGNDALPRRELLCQGPFQTSRIEGWMEGSRHIVETVIDRGRFISSDFMPLAYTCGAIDLSTRFFTNIPD